MQLVATHGRNKPIKVQIILRLYSSISEILHGFDIGSSAVGFDGTNVHFTSLSKYSYENMVNIYDGTRRSTTYEYRLAKYFNHGFDIIMPNLDITKITDNKVNLTYLPFTCESIDGNKIVLDRFLKDFSIKQSDYSDKFETYLINSDSLCYYNMDRLIKSIPPIFKMHDCTFEIKKNTILTDTFIKTFYCKLKTT